MKENMPGGMQSCLQCQIGGKMVREAVVTALEGHGECGQEGPFAPQAAADGQVRGKPQLDPLDGFADAGSEGMIPQVFQPTAGVMDDDEEMELAEPGDYDFEFSLFLFFRSLFQIQHVLNPPQDCIA